MSENGRPAQPQAGTPPAAWAPSALPAPADLYPPHDASEESRLLAEYLRALLRNKWPLLIFTLAGLLAGLAVSYRQKPVFRASASVEIQGLNGDFLNLKAFDPTTAFQEYSPEGEILTQAQIMQRDTLLDQVTQTVRANGGVSDAALDYASSHLDVRMIPGTHILEMICDSTDRQAAALFANAWAAAYIQENREARVQVTQQTEDSLRQQLTDVKATLEKADEALLGYARSNHLMFTGDDQSSVDEEKLRQTQTALSQAETERIARQSEYELIVKAPAGSTPVVKEDAGALERQTKLVEMRGQLADLLTYMAPTHPKVVRLQAEIAELDVAVRDQRTRAISGVRQEFDAAQLRENLLRADYDAQAQRVSDLAQKTIRYNILKREADTNRQLYESLLQKVKEAGVSKAMRAGNVHMVNSAKPPAVPYKPRVLMYGLMGLMAGLFLAIVSIAIRERADRNFRLPGEASLSLRLPELGAIPSAAKRRQAPLLIGATGLRPLALPTGAPALGPVSHGDGDLSAMAESFRAIITSLLTPARNGRGLGLVITSAGPGEGKSTVVSNLGLAMAETNRRVLLIDGDLRHPRLHEIFGLDDRSGLSELLLVEDPSPELVERSVIRASQANDLFLLPAGRADERTPNLLYSARLPKLLQRFLCDFDAVLIDSPPMLQAPDARILARVCGSAVLVIRAGQTSRDTAAAAKQRFAEDGTPLIGAILNDFSPSGSPNGYYSGYRSRNGRPPRDEKGA